MRKAMAGKAMAAAVILALGITGCGKKADAPKEAVETTRETTEAAQETTEEETVDPEQMELAKYNYYVELNNEIVRLLEDIDNYYKVVNFEEEFSLIKDSGLTYGYKISGFNSEIVDDCLALSDMEPRYETIDPLIKEMADPLRALMDAFSAMGKGGNYAENQYEKPKELHKIVYPLTDKFEAMSYEYMGQINQLANERIGEEEEKMKSEGKLIAYNASRCISIGNQIMDECSLQGVNDSNITELDLTKIRPMYDQLKQTIDDLNGATADTEQIMKESIRNSRPFDQLYERMLQALEWMIDQVESQRPIEDPSLEPLGSIAHFSNTLSDCIDRYNTVFVD